MNSINFTILEDFIHHYKIDESRINYLDRDQTKISLLKSAKMKNDTLIVTYIPYNLLLEKSGFQEIISTKDGLRLLVIDAMFTTQETLQKHKSQFIAIKKYTNQALEALQKDPKEFYDKVKPYMLDMSYDDFNTAIQGIIWINKNISPELNKRMQESAFNTRDIL